MAFYYFQYVCGGGTHTRAVYECNAQFFPGLFVHCFYICLFIIYLPINSDRQFVITCMPYAEYVLCMCAYVPMCDGRKKLM